MSRARNIGVQGPLGFSGGLPFLLTGATLSTWLATEGVDVKSIGLFALAHLPYNFKFLWAPLLDRFQLPLLGRRRGWIALCQLLLVIGIATLGMVDAAASPITLAVLALAVAVVSASQDIIIDAYRTDLLTDRERGKGVSAYIIGYRIAMLVAGAAALSVADALSWRAAYWLMAGVTGLCLITTLVAPEPNNTQSPRSLASAVVDPFAEFFTRSGALTALLFVMLFQLGDVSARILVNPFLVHLDFSLAEIGAIKQGMGMLATIAGTAAGGVMLDRLGLLRGVFLFGLLQAVANVGYVVLAITGKNMAVLVAAIAIDNFCNGLGAVAFVALLMALCNRSYSATQYALLSSASSVLGRFMGAASGYIVAATGWAVFFALTIVAVAPALLLLPWVSAAIPSSPDQVGGSDARAAS